MGASDIERRTLLEWLGSGTVLALGSPLLKACAGPQETSEDWDTGFSGEGFPFRPGDTRDEVFQGWRVRTVDPQDLAEILATWTLTIGGLVAEPVELTFSDLLELARQDQTTDFHCVEGWSVYDVPWNGVHISELLALVTPLPGATHVTFHTIGGDYNESLPLDVALEPRTLLAYGVNGSTLPFVHGFPLRLVVPRLFGYKSAKFVDRVELADGPVEGFWVARGYGYDGEVPESRLREGKY